MKISSKDVSIVVQGPNIPQQTEQCLKSLRRYFPQAEIIFSTYLHEDVRGLVANIVVKSKDPGAYEFKGIMYNNINRILTTTKAGLAKASRKYCLKIRSDLIVTNDKLLNNIAAGFPRREKAFSVFEERVIFYSLWSRKWEYILNRYKILCPFHISDWLCFGLTKDVKRYFMDIPPVKEPQYSEFFLNPRNQILPFYDPVTWQFPPEQYFATHFFKKFFPEADLKSRLDFSPEIMAFSRRVLVNNVIMCGYKEIGFYNQKKQYRFASKYINFVKGVWLGGVYRFGDFLKDYKQFCDMEYEIPLYYMLTSDYDVDEEMTKMHKHYRRFMRPFRYVLKWIEQFFSLVFYVVKIIYKSSLVFFNALTQK